MNNTGDLERHAFDHNHLLDWFEKKDLKPFLNEIVDFSALNYDQKVQTVALLLTNQLAREQNERLGRSLNRATWILGIATIMLFLVGALSLIR
jgi:hypothetical protein